MKRELSPIHNSESGQTTIEYLLLIVLAVVFFLGFNQQFSIQIKAYYKGLAQYLTSDLQTGQDYFDSWGPPKK